MNRDPSPSPSVTSQTQVRNSSPTPDRSSVDFGSDGPREPFRRTAVLELTFAGALWGFGFIAAVWALESMGPMTITGLRFAIAAAVGFALALLIPSLRRDLSFAQFRLAAIPGLWLCLTLILQTWGLKYTTATKSGFITTLYVLLVPVLESFWLKRRLPRFHTAFVIAGLVGVALICDVPGALMGKIPASSSVDAAKQAWNFGDVLTLLTAIAASFQILWFGRIQNQIRSSFNFNLYQCIWAGSLPLLLALVIERWPSDVASMSGKPLLGLLSLAFGSTLIAFALQVRAQKNISPSLASLLFLLESPFAALFAVSLLGENLRTEQWLGAGLILMSVVASTVFDTERKEVA